MLKTLVRFIKESEGAGMFEYAILLGVGVAAAAGLGALLVPQIRQAMPRAAPALSLAPLRATATPTPKKRQGPSQGLDHVARVAVTALRLLTNRFLRLILLLLIRLFCQPTQKETPTMHPPDGPLARLHSPEQRPFSAFCHQNPFPPMPPTGNESGWHSDYSPPGKNLRKWEMAE